MQDYKCDRILKNVSFGTFVKFLFLSLKDTISHYLSCIKFQHDISKNSGVMNDFVSNSYITNQLLQFYTDFYRWVSVENSKKILCLLINWFLVIILQRRIIKTILSSIYGHFLLSNYIKCELIKLYCAKP